MPVRGRNGALWTKREAFVIAPPSGTFSHR